MQNWFSRLTVNRGLALLAGLLGFGALFASVEPRRVVAIHEKDLLTAVERQDDHVKPIDLAAWIIAGRSDYRLIDLRDQGAFDQYHIPTAENVSLSALTDAGLLRNQRIILYSEGGIHAAQAWMLLRAKGYAGASTLLGGLDGWKDEVLFPTPPSETTPETTARFERMAVVAGFFGGQPRTPNSAALDSRPELPKINPVTPVEGTNPPSKPKKRKEGC